MSDFYYSDSCFQLELNLQETRRELIALIEACELKDSALCPGIRCCYPDTVPTDNESKEDVDTDQEPGKLPPLADLLPKPKWDTSEAPSVSDTEFTYDVQSWLKTGMLNNQPNPSEITSSRTAYKKTGNNKKSPSPKAGKSVYNGNISYLDSTANKSTESTGQEFCLKFAENAYNLDVIMKMSALNRTGYKPCTNKEQANSIASTPSKNAVDAFFRSFKDGMSATSRVQTNMIEKVIKSVHISSNDRDYAYFN